MIDVPGPEGFVPTLTPAEAAAIERAAVEVLGLSRAGLVERAGAIVARVARDRLFEGDPRGKALLVAAGDGFAGAAARVAARCFADWGATVTVVAPPGERALPGPQDDAPQRALERARIGILGVDRLASTRAWAIIEALGPQPHPTAVEAINARATPVLSVGLPAGLDPATGVPGPRTVVANATVAFTLPLPGLVAPRARRYVGDAFLAELLPLFLVTEAGLPVEPLFAKSDLLRLF